MHPHPKISESNYFAIRALKVFSPVNSALVFVSIILSNYCFGQIPSWVWAKSGTGSSSDRGYAVTTDGNNNIITTGYIGTSPVTFGTVTVSNSSTSYTDIFIAKYDPSGNVLWAKSAGGNNADEGLAVAADASGNIFVAGVFASVSVVFGSDTLNNSSGASGDVDLFIAKYDPSGNVLWARRAGGTGIPDAAYGLTTDPNGNAIITGIFASSSITFGSITLNKTSGAGATDAFVAKYDGNGNALWAKTIAGPKAKEAWAVDADAGGNIIVTGGFKDSVLTIGSTSLVNQSGNCGVGYCSDIYVVKYDTAGNVLWAKGAGGTNSEFGYGISTDANNNIYVTGYFQSPQLAFGSTTLTHNSYPNAGTPDFFVAKYDANGSELWAKNAGGTDYDQGLSVIAGANGAVVTGFFQSPSIVFGATTLTNTNSGSNDIFVVKYNAAGNIDWAISEGGTATDRGTGIASDGNGDLYVTGWFSSGTLNFGSNALTNPAPIFSSDIFLAKLGISSGLEDYSSSSVKLLVFPNPANNTVTVRCSQENSAYEIFDVTGGKVLSGNLSGTQKIVDLTSIQPGIYFLRAGGRTVKLVCGGM